MFWTKRWCILTGNPGISKSWFQWKFILFCYRLDLFDRFSPVIDEILLDEPETEELETEDEASTEQVVPFIPQLIVRTEAGEDSWLFFVGRNDTDVVYVKHDLSSLRFFSDENTTILWEPGSSMTPVYYEGVKARIIATVSNEKLFHEFKKEQKCSICPVQVNCRFD